MFVIFSATLQKAIYRFFDHDINNFQLNRICACKAVLIFIYV